MQKIAASDLVNMYDFVHKEPLNIDLVYAQANHPENIFKCALYRANAPFLLYYSMADIVVRAARLLHDRHGWTSVLMDGLRPVEAQEAMQQTDIVKRNPHWCREPNRLLSPPGKGGHPRGMAVDIVCLDADGVRIDMGTPFDYLSEDPANNPAARRCTNFPADILNNRACLERAMCDAAADVGLPILPLPAEWWDFRFPPSYSNEFAPICDKDLPAALRMTM